MKKVQERRNVSFRCIAMKHFDQEMQLIQSIYNDAWEKNWGFVPLSQKEFAHIAKDMKLILDPRLCLLAQVNGQPAGFALAVPDVNQAFAHVKDGKLFPTGLLKLLWHLKAPKKKTTVQQVRIITLGIKKEFQHLGLGPLLYAQYKKIGPSLGFNQGEAGWILEDNKPMNEALLQMNARKSKTYRLFSKPL
jgi:hypothetical protein